MTKTDGSLIGWQFVFNFEHWDFGIVSDFDIRISWQSPLLLNCQNQGQKL